MSPCRLDDYVLDVLLRTLSARCLSVAFLFTSRLARLLTGTEDGPYRHLRQFWRMTGCRNQPSSEPFAFSSGAGLNQQHRASQPRADMKSSALACAAGQN